MLIAHTQFTCCTSASLHQLQQGKGSTTVSPDVTEHFTPGSYSVEYAQDNTVSLYSLDWTTGLTQNGVKQPFSV